MIEVFLAFWKVYLALKAVRRQRRHVEDGQEGNGWHGPHQVHRPLLPARHQGYPHLPLLEFRLSHYCTAGLDRALCPIA